VPNGAIVSKSKEQFDHLVQQKLDSLPAGYSFKNKDQIPRTSDEHDRAAMDWIDPSVRYAPAKSAAGTLASDFVSPNAIGDSLAWIKRQAEQIGTNQMRVLYDSQLGIARARSAVETRVAGSMAKPTRNIFDEYQTVALGSNLADSATSISGSVMKPLEEQVNKGISATWPAMQWMAPSQLGKWVNNLAEHMGAKTPAATATFNQLTHALGPHSPYQNAIEYAEQNFKVSRPPEIREITQKIGRLSSTTSTVSIRSL